MCNLLLASLLSRLLLQLHVAASSAEFPVVRTASRCGSLLLSLLE